MQFVQGDPKYTRKRSEALFHLIQWQDYTLATWKKAFKEQKPIYLVISAPSWCHWCHVYESEDYLYHPKLYPYINNYFIPIFVDSDKRPDLTKKYLEGGWPSTTILAPDLQRLTGFSGPRDPEGLLDDLQQIIDDLKDKKFTEFSRSAHYEEAQPRIPTARELVAIEDQFLFSLKLRFDKSYGGFIDQHVPDWREQQKFPTGFIYKYLLEKYDETGTPEYLAMVKTTFEQQYTDIEDMKRRYRLYDPVEGGFHRYSTRRDWSAPHYEKMLADQAKLIRAYAHLFAITHNLKMKKVVDCSVDFVLKKFYDKEGGFYNSQDAYLEDAYYGLLAQERKNLEPPYIDRTRVMENNAMMMSTLVYVYAMNNDKHIYDATKKSFEFLRTKMTGHDGAHAYFDYEMGGPFLTGQAAANAWAIVAFLDGYTILGEQTHLKTAEALATYALDNLYDWDTGGFFERNSKDTVLYAPSENIDLSKPYPENAVFSYGMVQLYIATKHLAYLESGLKTLGYLVDRLLDVDETYFILKAVKLVRENRLLDVYKKQRNDVAKLVEQQKRAFSVRRQVKQ